MARIYVRTFWRFSQWVGEVDDANLVFVRWNEESVGYVNSESSVFDAETNEKLGTVNDAGRVCNASGVEIGWIKKPFLSIFRAKVYMANPGRWFTRGLKWYGKVRSPLWASDEVRRREWYQGGAALLLLLHGRHRAEMSRDVDEALGNWDLVYPASLAFVALFLLPGVISLLHDRLRVFPFLGKSLSYLATAFLLWWALFGLAAMAKRQFAAGRAFHARRIRKEVLDLLNRRTGLTGRGKGMGARRWGFDLWAMLWCAVAAVVFLFTSLTLFPMAAAGLVAFCVLWLRASPEPWRVAPRYRDAPLPHVPEQGPPSDDTCTERYSWCFQGMHQSRDFEAQVQFRLDNVRAARAANPFGSGGPFDHCEAGRRIVLTGEGAGEVHQAAYALRKLAQDWKLTEYEELQNTLEFVQTIRYALDVESIDRLKNAPLGIPEYWRYPIETLFDRNGDCDCKAILAAALFHLTGFRAMLLVSFDPEIAHAAVAVEVGQNIPEAPFFRDKEGRRYYFCETTARSWEIGERPSPEFDGRFQIIALQ